MKTVWMVLAVVGVMAWSASWVSACEGCGCKAKAAKADAKGDQVAAETAVKCVACPAGKNAEAKCPGTCKEGCCKGDATKCATCKVCAEGKACKGQAAGTAAKACSAGATAAGEAKGCGAAAAAGEAKTCGAAAAGEAKACGAAKGAK